MVTLDCNCDVIMFAFLFVVRRFEFCSNGTDLDFEYCVLVVVTTNAVAEFRRIGYNTWVRLLAADTIVWQPVLVVVDDHSRSDNTIVVDDFLER